MPTKRRFLSIRLQLTLAIFAAALVVLGVSAALVVFWESRDSRDQAVQLAATVTEVLSQDFVRIVVLDSPDVAADMVMRLQAFPAVHNATFFDANDQPVLNFTRDGVDPVDARPSPSPSAQVQGGFSEIRTPVRYMGSTYGTAWFRVDLSSIDKSFGGFLKRLALVAPLLLLFSMLVALFVQRIFTRPIRTLARALDSFGSGPMQEVELKQSAPLEIAQLFQGFHRMTNRIRQTQNQLSEQKERLLVTLESIADGVIATDGWGRILYMNPAAESVTEWSEIDALGRPVEEIYRLIDEESEQPLNGQIDETLLGGTVQFGVEHIALRTKNSRTVAIQSSIAPIRDHEKKVIGAVVIFQNVTEARELSNQLRHQATHDPLTELINRSEFELRLSQALTQVDAETRHVLLYLDLDQFKLINDTSGHTAGDALLKHIAVLLRESVRDSDIVARLGGDEFAILLPNCGIEQAREIAEKIRNQIRSFSFVWEDHAFKVGVSIGVVPVDDPMHTQTELLSAADIACYAAKDLGRNRIHVYHSEDTDLLQRHGEMQWVNLLSEAIESHNLLLYIQRIDPLQQTDSPVHYEVLVRYMNAEGVISLPGAFLPAAERYGLISRIDRWVIRTLLTDDRVIDHLRRFTGQRININLSGLTLNEPNLADFVSDLLKRATLPPQSICFEVTETAAVSNLAATSRFMRSMKLLGCEFALDDFGSGVSSFAYLKNLPVDYLKIDGGFVQDVDTNAINRAMVESINNIGHVMGIKTVAEFADHPQVVKVLRQLGVDYAQGYHIHMPAPLEELFAPAARQPKNLRTAPPTS